MAKDPAVNWYFDNWTGGTMGLSRFQKGCYMDLLSAQYHIGHLSLDAVKNILGNDFSAWQVLQSKFAQDENGNYFNERLEHEVRKREKNSFKNAVNGKKGGRPKKTNENPNHNPNETQTKAYYEIGIETENGFKEKKEGVGERKTSVERFSVHSDLKLPVQVLEAVQLNQHAHTKGENTDFILSQWQIFLSERMADPPDKQQHFRRAEDLSSYFINWMRNKFPANKNERKTNAKTAGAYQLLDSLRQDLKTDF